jgi:transposase-like protein
MRKHYSAAFKAKIVLEALTEEKSIAQLVSEHGIHPNQIGKWKAQALEDLPSLFVPEREAEHIDRAAHERELQELYAEIGRLTTQLAWLEKKSGIRLDPR